MIAAPDTLNAEQKAVFEQIVGGPRGASSPFPLANEHGDLLGPFGLMVRFPNLGGSLQALGSAIRYETSLTARAREIAIITVARFTNSEFEAYAHRLVALNCGFTLSEVTALLEGKFKPASDDEREVLQLSEALLRGTALESLPTGGRMCDQTTAEVVTLVGYYRLLAQLMQQFNVGVPPVKPRELSIPVEGTAHSLSVDLYEAPRADAPLLLYLHGGGWTTGSRKDYSDRFAALVQRGVSVASLDYRLATEAPYPAQRDDVAAAVRALRADGRPILLAGASAGATLAGLAAQDPSIAVDGFIGMFGRYDLTKNGDRLAPDSSLEPPSEIVEAIRHSDGPSLNTNERLALLAGSPTLDTSILERLSPASGLHPASPPMLLVHGTADAIVNHRHSVRFAERAHQLGVHCDLLLVPGANHEGEEFAAASVADEIAQFAQDISNSPQKEGQHHEHN